MPPACARVAEADDLARFLCSNEVEVLRMVQWAGVTRQAQEEE